jgi:hypothetical protein
MSSSPTSSPRTDAGPPRHAPDPGSCQGCADLKADGHDLARLAAVEHRLSYSVLIPQDHDAPRSMRRWLAAS